ncbi:hypothetical protein DPMN_015122 [Dreissena polymorpha]|uniref:Uncharacterized protein n=1 Tax=Dreissena polymorpha TaxID=45954 RepID=A0A9D4S454_DREPO|nr:hypothetical protein DPMN_015122 [Dreissena polymorpha]
MKLLSTPHCMKTKQLSVVRHRQQQIQTQLTLETVKLRSLTVPIRVECNILNEVIQSHILSIPTQETCTCSVYIQIKAMAKHLSMKVCVNEAGHTTVYVHG